MTRLPQSATRASLIAALVLLGAGGLTGCKDDKAAAQKADRASTSSPTPGAPRPAPPERERRGSY